MELQFRTAISDRGPKGSHYIVPNILLGTKVVEALLRIMRAMNRVQLIWSCLPAVIGYFCAKSFKLHLMSCRESCF
jgi:hypothetical protein